MQRRQFIKLLGSGLATLTGLKALAGGSVAHTDRVEPNILFILTDDLGHGDLGCCGHPWHETPNIDSLANRGMRFIQAYAPAPICSASRGAILTGRTPARLNLEFVTKSEPGSQKITPPPEMVTPPYTLDLPLSEKTIAEYLGESGYETAFFGKWHLNRHYRKYLGWSPTHGPRQQGFQYAVEDFGSHPYNKKAMSVKVKPGEIPRDSLTDKAIEFIKRTHDKPFFMMLSHFYVHTPVRTPCKWLIEKYDAKVPAGAANRDKRLAYAAFVETLDHYVGQVLSAVEQAGLGGNTVVVFTSDNGGHPEFASNKPLRGAKWNLYEGGIRVPMIARWPGVISPGSTCDAPVAGYDMPPTFAQIAGCDMPAKGIDGSSLRPLLADSRTDLNRDLYWHFPYYHPEAGFAEALPQIGIDDFAVSQTRPQSALRRGRYKVLYFHEHERVELYDLLRDPGEQHDLSASRPELAKQLAAALMDKLRQANARFPTRPKQD